MIDRILGTVLITFAAFYLWQTTQIPVSFFSDVVGPRTFPYILGFILIFCGFFLVAFPDPSIVWPAERRFFETFSAIVVFVLYALLLPEIGFLFATFFVIAYLTWRLGSPPREVFLISVSASVSLWLIFKVFFGLSLAQGPWGF